MERHACLSHLQVSASDLSAIARCNKGVGSRKGLSDNALHGTGNSGMKSTMRRRISTGRVAMPEEFGSPSSWRADAVCSQVLVAFPGGIGFLVSDNESGRQAPGARTHFQIGPCFLLSYVWSSRLAVTMGQTLSLVFPICIAIYVGYDAILSRNS